MTTPKKYAVPALDKGLDILEYLVSQEVPRSQTEIAQGLGRGANEIYRVLVGLEARGYLVRDELSGRYRLSLKLYNLSRSISPIDQLRQVALPFMEDLAVKIGQSCHLCMLYQSKTMVLIHARSQIAVSINIAEGSLFPTLSTTSGRVLLANSNTEVRKMILERDSLFNNMDKSQQEALYNELEGIKQHGFHADKNVLSEGIDDFSALVGQPEGKVIAALGVSIIQNKHEQQMPAAEMNDLIIKTAQNISRQLGC